MQFFILILLGFFSLVLEATILCNFTLWGVKPDLLLIYVILFSLHRGSKKGTIMGVMLGFLEDLFLAKYIGMNTLIKGIIGYWVGVLEKRIYKENFLVPIIMVLLGSSLAGFMFYLFAKLLTFPVSLVEFKQIVFPMVIYNTLLTPFISFYFHKYMKKVN